MTTAYDALIQQIATVYSLPFPLLQAQVMQESSANPFAFRYEPVYYAKYIHSHPDAKGFLYGPDAACSRGLLQILWETALEHGFIGAPWDLYDPQKNLDLGASIMRHLWDWAGGTENDYPRALSAYNGGTGAAHSGPPFRNQGYVDAVYRIAGHVVA